MWSADNGSPGPNPANSIITEKVFMQFTRIKEISAPEGGQKVTRCTSVLAPPTLKLTGGEYILPNVKVGAMKNKGDPSINFRGERDKDATIRVTNLPENTRESDLQEVFRPFGPISSIYLAKDKNTGQSKGFAFINFLRREDASRTIQGFSYDNLNVEWAKPDTQQK